jgi:hypothetical protein
MRMAMVKNGVVENIVEVQEGSGWHPGEGFDLIGMTTGEIGWTCVDGQFAPPVVPAVAAVPASVTPLQMRRALRRAGLHDLMAEYVATLGEEAHEAWEYATVIDRADPLLAAAAQALGKGAADLDALFILAAGL